MHHFVGGGGAYCSWTVVGGENEGKKIRYRYLQ